jgi:hypothetical protein
MAKMWIEPAYTKVGWLDVFARGRAQLNEPCPATLNMNDPCGAKCPQLPKVL